MNNAPVIDLSLRSPRQIIADKGLKIGLAQVVWFRLVRPASVGSMWAAIGVYIYRYLMPFDEGDLPLEQLVSYLVAIGSIASGLTLWMIASRVAHPFASRSRMQRLVRRTAGLTVEPGPLAAMSMARRGAVSRIFVASHDSNGLIAALKALSNPAPRKSNAAPARRPTGRAESGLHWPESPAPSSLNGSWNASFSVHYVVGRRREPDAGT
ncbi:hypothetical protein [Paraburkholderia phytofirmans]|uniref:hypothetical protein n=1 Tax=Paraburkholderia TaxID=1822464 RepID=UPI0007B606B7|nr:hypothetical protein [Paraburkholderia phytofirmans]